MINHNGSTTGFYRTGADGKYTSISQPNGGFVANLITGIARGLYQLIRYVKG